MTTKTNWYKWLDKKMWNTNNIDGLFVENMNVLFANGHTMPFADYYLPSQNTDWDNYDHPNTWLVDPSPIYVGDPPSETSAYSLWSQITGECLAVMLDQIDGRVVIDSDQLLNHIENLFALGLTDDPLTVALDRFEKSWQIERKCCYCEQPATHRGLAAVAVQPLGETSEDDDREDKRRYWPNMKDQDGVYLCDGCTDRFINDA